MKLLSLSEFIAERYTPNYNNILLEGGAFGHMAHPFEDFTLTFRDVKEIINLSLQGNLSKEILPQEKLDGQAIAISWKNGRLIAARNKGDRRNYGENGLSVSDVYDKFKNHPKTLRDAFSFAVKDLEKSLSKLNEKELKDIFKEGKRFMHLEILWPDNPNVIEYGVSNLIFHTVTEYNEKGDAIDDIPDDARKLERIIFKVNADIQKHFKIVPPIGIKLPEHIDFSDKQQYFFKKVSKLQSESNLSDNDKIGDYIKYMFINEIKKNDIDSESDEILITGLINRWANGIKSFTIRDIKKHVENAIFLEWILNFDKKEASKKLKEYLFPLEVIFLELGATILKNATGFLAANPDKVVQKIRRDLEASIKKIESSGDVKSLNILQQQMAKIDAIGGFDAIIPSEGIVFVYKDKTYKFTGAFAPVNRIIGLLKF